MTADVRQSLLYICSSLCFIAVGAALISQHVYDMPPCAWCVFQRLIFVVLGVVCLIGAMSKNRLARGAAGVGALVAVGGIAAAWYQYTVAAHLFSCDQTFADRFMVQSGLDSAMPAIFGIMAGCMEAQVELLGIEYVFWSLGLFFVLAALLLRVALRPAA
ncbi:MAG: disulfide bond formation protein B [Burkholderiaceae bacterium]|nr:disulfide bond formation protein B [Burkholderiaceae bacterium]